MNTTTDLERERDDLLRRLMRPEGAAAKPDPQVPRRDDAKSSDGAMLLQLTNAPGTRDVSIRLDDSGPWVRVHFKDGYARVSDLRVCRRLVDGGYAVRVDGAAGSSWAAGAAEDYRRHVMPDGSIVGHTFGGHFWGPI
jgi:hypothetical protein